MARESFVYDPILRKMVPKAFYRAGAGDGLLVIPDIKPYRSVIDGSEIGGRRQHREHLRANGCIEVGTEKIPQQRQTATAPGLRNDVIRAMEQRK